MHTRPSRSFCRADEVVDQPTGGAPGRYCAGGANRFRACRFGTPTRSSRSPRALLVVSVANRLTKTSRIADPSATGSAARMRAVTDAGIGPVLDSDVGAGAVLLDDRRRRCHDGNPERRRFHDLRRQLVASGARGPGSAGTRVKSRSAYTSGREARGPMEFHTAPVVDGRKEPAKLENSMSGIASTSSRIRSAPLCGRTVPEVGEPQRPRSPPLANRYEPGGGTSVRHDRGRSGLPTASAVGLTHGHARERVRVCRGSGPTLSATYPSRRLPVSDIEVERGLQRLLHLLLHETHVVVVEVGDDGDVRQPLCGSGDAIERRDSLGDPHDHLLGSGPLADRVDQRSRSVCAEPTNLQVEVTCAGPGRGHHPPPTSRQFLARPPPDSC